MNYIYHEVTCPYCNGGMGARIMAEQYETPKEFYEGEFVLAKCYLCQKSFMVKFYLDVHYMYESKKMEGLNE